MSLFANIPFPLTALILAIAGACVGALVNLGIYQLCYFEKRLISPWSPAPDSLGKRTLFDRLPIVGWFALRRESAEFGPGHWVRPMLIEIGCAAGLVGLYWWYARGGLGTGLEQVSIPADAVLMKWNSLWFLLHATLFVLLTIATFIDFDERTIPDWITIPGTLFALTVAFVAPQTRLPVQIPNFVDITIEPLNFCSPLDLSDWYIGSYGLWAGFAVIVVWCFGLLPKLVTFRYGLFNAWKLMWATLWPRPRKTKCKFRKHDRHLTTYHLMIFVVLVVACAGIGWGWSRGGEAWLSLFSSLMGMAFGGGLTWAVRIIASAATGREAMGFGDVTLMAMIGAFVGWQPSLLIFAFAPFTSMIVVVIQMVSSSDSKIAFGPYLCIAALIVVVGWNPIWNQWAGDTIFTEGSRLLIIIAGCLGLMGIMMFGLVKLRRQPEE